MKKISVLLFALALSLCACTATPVQSEAPDPEVSRGPTWQEQYDLGIRYLSEGNYEEAIIAFTAAIDIDPKQAPAYVGRGDAYAAIAESSTAEVDAESYRKAVADYIAAIDLGDAEPEVYQKAADIYVILGNPEAAQAVLEQSGEISEEPEEQPEETAEPQAAEITKQAACDTVWYGLYGSDLLYEFNPDGTGRLLKTLSENGGPFTYQVEDMRITIQEAEFTYVWEYDSEQEVFLWDISSQGRIGADLLGDLDNQGRLIMCAVTPEEYRPLLALGEEEAESLAEQIAAHYNDQLQPSGTYACFSSELHQDFEQYTLILRYQISNEEAEEILAAGLIPDSNIYTSTIWVNKQTGEVTDEILEESWYIELP